MEDTILKSITHYCRYQERCHKEVRNKLYELGCTTPDVEAYLSALIEAGLLNEERYARTYARGKFRMLHWGRVKIISQLQFSQVSPYCIKKGLQEIDEEEYLSVLQRLAKRKWDELRKVPNAHTRRSKVQYYLRQKGFENDLIMEAFNKVIE